MPFEHAKNDAEKKAKCLHDTEILSDGGCRPCAVEQIVSKDLIFVKMTEENQGCPYSLSFGSSYICKWPLRHEIYFEHHQ